MSHNLVMIEVQLALDMMFLCFSIVKKENIHPFWPRGVVQPLRGFVGQIWWLTFQMVHV